MMRKTLSLFTTITLLLFSCNFFGQNFKDLDASPMDIAAFPLSHNISDKLVRVMYSRPQLKGRTVASLTPSGKVWRTGANEATEITFYKNVTFGSKVVSAGTYTLFTIPGEKEWTVILNSDLNIWGAYDYNSKNDVARIVVPLTYDENELEAFSMAFNTEGTLFLGWGNLRVAIPIKEN
ncbi:MAG TPA: DUF2911 domain-containing protein [Flavobacteriaceae bacterium]|nr:DUF2911 domain-containing protein [Flavobacteriaceae bacterium]